MLTSIRHAKPMSRAVETHDLSRTLNASEKSQSACSVPTHSNDRKVDHRKPWATRRVTCHISDHRRKLRCAPNVAPIAATCSIILPLREHPFMPFIPTSYLRAFSQVPSAFLMRSIAFQKAIGARLTKVDGTRGHCHRGFHPQTNHVQLWRAQGSCFEGWKTELIYLEKTGLLLPVVLPIEMSKA